MQRIALVGATGKDWWAEEKKVSFVKSITPKGYELLNYNPRYGTHSVESHVDEAYNAPYILEQVVKAEKDGCNAIVIDCFCDPILDAAREVSSIPVLGPGSSSIHLARILGKKFSIITVSGKSLVQCIEEAIRIDGMQHYCVGVRAIQFPVLEIANKPAIMEEKLLDICRETKEEDNADVIILGCTGLSHEIDIHRIMSMLKVPIIDPLIIAIKLAVDLLEMGLSHSKLAYPMPPKKPIKEPDCLEGFFDEVLKS